MLKRIFSKREPFISRMIALALILLQLGSFSAINICEYEEPQPMRCVCPGYYQKTTISKADCWILSNITKDDNLWPQFSTQPNLTHLTFLKRPPGNFNFIPTESIASLKHLNELVVTYANLDRINSFAFGNSSSLQKLQLARNEIVMLEHFSFAHLKNLTEINLDENYITHLHRDVFVDLPKLERMFITKNNLSKIDEDAFLDLNKLLEFELSYNRILEIRTNTFRGLSSLRRLDLGQNHIREIHDFVFSHLTKLEVLTLENNQIFSIAPSGFKGLSSIQKINLRSNQLIKLPGGVLNGLSNLVNLDLRSNFLETLTLDTMQPLVDNLKNYTSGIIYIQENKLFCDCRLAWLQLFNTTENRFLKSVLDKTTCYLNITDITPIEAPINNNSLPTLNNATPENGKPENLTDYEYIDEYIDTDTSFIPDYEYVNGMRYFTEVLNDLNCFSTASNNDSVSPKLDPNIFSKKMLEIGETNKNATNFKTIETTKTTAAKTASNNEIAKSTATKNNKNSLFLGIGIVFYSMYIFWN